MRAAVCLLLAAAGCAAAPVASGAPASAPPPPWVSAGESPQWPRALYMTGVGAADDRGSAELRAKHQIAVVFGGELRSQVQVSESEHAVRSGDAAATAWSQRTSQDVLETTRRASDGIEIADAWRDAGGRWYALAVLERRKAAAEWLAAVADLDRALALDAPALERGDRLGRAAAGARILSALRRRAALEHDLRIVEAAVPAPARPVPDLERDARRALGAVVLALELEGEEGAALRAGVSRALEGLGLRLATGGDAPDVALRGGVVVSPQEGDPRLVMVRASARLTGTDLAAGQVCLAVDASAREGALGEEEARRRSVASLARALARNVEASLTGWLEGRHLGAPPASAAARPADAAAASRVPAAAAAPAPAPAPAPAADPAAGADAALDALLRSSDAAAARIPGAPAPPAPQVGR